MKECQNKKAIAKWFVVMNDTGKIYLSMLFASQ